jgi:hypothetical protein
MGIKDASAHSILAVDLSHSQGHPHSHPYVIEVDMTYPSEIFGIAEPLKWQNINQMSDSKGQKVAQLQHARNDPK